MSDRCFVDTNIIAYAHDTSAGDKRLVASSLLETLWVQRNGAVSVQVLQELYVTLRRKVATPLDRDEALAVIEDYASWQVVVNDLESVREAVRLEARHGISFWDALIVQAAHTAACAVLYTEDLNHGQTYGDVRATNPFLKAT